MTKTSKDKHNKRDGNPDAAHRDTSRDQHDERTTRPDPGRTPGQAEGTIGDVTGGGHAVADDPGRTPGQAEGTRGDVAGTRHDGGRGGS